MKDLSNTTAARMSVTSAVSSLGRPVAFYPTIARAFGDVSTALIVCQFMYWRGRVGEREIYKTQAEIEKETCVPAHTQRRVLKRLSDLGMVTVEKKGIPARNHFEWHWDAVDTFVSDYILQSQQDVTTSTNKLSPLDMTDCHDNTEQSVTTNTETTTETTTDIPPNPQGGSAVAPDDHPAKTKPAKPKAIPFEQIKNLFNEILPEVPAVILLNKPRQAAIRARWNEHPVHQDLGFWTDLFNDIRKSDFLMGRVLSDRPFILTFDWLLRPSNFVKVVEGNYHG